MEFIQIPTSLLAVVDSSVGGKTGVNLNAGKNLAGAFWQPSAVLFDPDVLDTLSYDLKLDGIAEAVKAGIIGDPGIITAVSGDIPADDAGFLTDLAAMAVEVKRKVVEEDERESGVRQLLNLGHTPAHAIEKCSSYSIRHGHAVAMGMAIVATAAAAMGWTSAECRDDIISILKRFGFPLNCPYSPAQLAEAAFRDKKVRGSSITWSSRKPMENARLRPSLPMNSRGSSHWDWSRNNDPTAGSPRDHDSQTDRPSTNTA